MIRSVIIHMLNDMPLMVDMEELPAGGDRMLRCVNVRGLDGKRPSFVHDRKSTFILPLAIIRVMEVPLQSGASPQISDDESDMDHRALVPTDSETELVPADEENEEDLLARIRQI